MDLGRWKSALDSGSGGRDGGSLGGGDVRLRLTGLLLVLGSVDGNFDGNLATADILALKSLDGLVLLGFITDINETVSLAATGLSPTTANNASRGDGDTGLGKELGETGILNVEAKVGDEEDGLGGFANGVFASSTRSASRLLLGRLFLGGDGAFDGCDSAFDSLLGLLKVGLVKVETKRTMKNIRQPWTSSFSSWAC